MWYYFQSGTTGPPKGVMISHDNVSKLQIFSGFFVNASKWYYSLFGVYDDSCILDVMLVSCVMITRWRQNYTAACVKLIKSECVYSQDFLNYAVVSSRQNLQILKKILGIFDNLSEVERKNDISVNISILLTKGKLKY